MMLICTATSYEARRTSYIWREAWCEFTDYDKLFPGDFFLPILSFELYLGGNWNHAPWQ